MIQVEIDGKGKVEQFPDGTSQETIDRIIQDRYFSKPAAPVATNAGEMGTPQYSNKMDPVNMFGNIVSEAGKPTAATPSPTAAAPAPTPVKRDARKDNPLYQKWVNARRAGTQQYEAFKKAHPEDTKQLESKEGITPKQVAELVYPFVKPLRGAGYSLFKGLNEGMKEFSKGMDTMAGYVSAYTGISKGGFFENAAKQYEENTEYWKKKAKEDGVGAVSEFFMETVGGAVPGIADFILGPTTAGIKGAAGAKSKGENELVGALRGAMERGMMGKLMHTASVLSSPLKATSYGGLFAGQAASQGETNPTNLAKAAGTGVIFSAGRGGKVRAKDIVQELYNLEKEAAPVAKGIMSSERGAVNLKPALKVDEGIYKAGSTHGDIYGSVPTEKLERAKNIDTGWVDEKGKWYSDQEARYVRQGDELGVDFNGMQHRVKGKPSVPLFTDRETGATFGLKEGENLQGKVEEVREKFKREEGTTLGMGLGAVPDKMLKGLDRWLSPTKEQLGKQAEKQMPAEEWWKRIKAWGEKNPRIKDENQWNGLQAWVESKRGEKGGLKKDDIMEFLELSKGKWAVKEQVYGSNIPEYEIVKRKDLDPQSGQFMVMEKGEELGVALYPTKAEAEEFIARNQGQSRDWKHRGEDPWSDRNVPGGVPGTAKVWTLSLPPHAKTEGDMENIKELENVLNDLTQKRYQLESQHKIKEANKLSPQISMIQGEIYSINARFKGEDMEDAYRSPHFSNKPNVVLHFRTQEIKDSTGAKGVLIETVQSDWHQQRTDIPGVVYKTNEGKYYTADPRTGAPLVAYQWFPTREEAEKSLSSIGNKSPAAPFEHTWAEVGLKHAIDIAAQDPSVKWVGWSSGKVQNERWGKGGEEIDNQLQTLKVGKNKWIVADEEGGDYTGETYKSEIEAETARQKCLNDALKESSGTFLTTLYDKRLPKFAKKYAEKIGGKYGTDVLTSGEDLLQEFPIHRIDLTPAMRQHINTKGQEFYMNPAATVVGAGVAGAIMGAGSDDKHKNKMLYEKWKRSRNKSQNN